MNNFKIIYLYRHGETNLNVSGITMGQLSSLHTEFTELGYEQIENINKKIIDNNIEVIYASDFERTFKTAQIANTNLPLYSTKKLRGLNMGNYQGHSMDEFLNSEEAKICFEDHNIKFSNGESINDLNARIINFIFSVCSSTSYTRIALITHSAVISNLYSYLSQNEYYSLNECVLLYQDNKLKILQPDNVKNKALLKRRK